MSDFEKLSIFKERFDNKLDAYNTAIGTNEIEEISAMNFLSKLCRIRFGSYYAYKMNLINQDESNAPKTVNEVFQEANTYIAPYHSSKDTTRGGVTFATADAIIGQLKRESTKRGRGRSGLDIPTTPTNNPTTPTSPPSPPSPTSTSGSSSSSSTSTPTNQGSTRDLSNVECYNCNEMGHLARNCPKKGNLSGMTHKGKLPKWYEIGLDTMSQVNVCNPRLLTNIRPSQGSYRGLSGPTSTTTYEGDLNGFFPCQVCDTCSASILSAADVEDLYPITYQQGVSYTVHMGDRDLVFYRKDNLYVADFSDWITDAGLSMMTIEEREQIFSKKQVKQAQEAGKFLAQAGYPSEQTAVKLIRDGNIEGITVGVEDIKRYFEIYGEPLPSIRGKTTWKKSSVSEVYDEGIKDQQTIQTLTADVAWIGGVKFLTSVSDPMNLLTSGYVKSLGEITLGRSLQGHLDIYNMFGFQVRQVMVDPLKALEKLRGKFPGTEIDVTGANDHLPAIDIKIRRLKELCRTMIQSLDYPMPKCLIRFLVTYCVSRINTRSGSGGNVCPRVRLTGRKISYKREFALKFGDYVEVKADSVSNSMQARTMPCIALYPTTSINGAWRFLNLDSKLIISRSVYVIPKFTPDNVIKVMQELGRNGVIKAEDLDSNTGVADVDDEQPDIIELDFKEEESEERNIRTHKVDPNIIEALGTEIELEDTLLEERVDDEEEGNVGDDRVLTTRRSNRATAGKTSRYDGYVFTCVNATNESKIQAIKDELTQLLINKALKVIPWNQKDPTGETIPSFMLLKEKYDALGNFEKVKARLVCDGSKQSMTEN